jgi:aspartate carbamoyltransferase catalytic subunit
MGTHTKARHLLGIEGLSRQDIVAWLDEAEYFWNVARGAERKLTALRGRTVLNLFYESSTRTRTSFELAGKRLSADVVNISVATSSVTKGETLSDTCRTLDAMRPDVLVVRHAASGAAAYVASKVGCSVVNAGDGAHEHPTQALLDAFTIRHHRGSLEGLTVAICGDIVHSRVARSNIHLLRQFGAEIRVAGPETLLPHGIGALGVRVCPRLHDAVEGAHVVMALRIQQERMKGHWLPSMRDYAAAFCLSERHLKLAARGALVMHPGPMNRGVEISPELADHAQSVVLDQVEAGLAVRMAVLHRLTLPSSNLPAPTLDPNVSPPA